MSNRIFYNLKIQKESISFTITYLNVLKLKGTYLSVYLKILRSLIIKFNIINKFYNKKVFMEIKLKKQFYDIDYLEYLNEQFYIEIKKVIENINIRKNKKGIGNNLIFFFKLFIKLSYDLILNKKYNILYKTLTYKYIIYKL